jgi:hypothetical protein
VYDMSYEGLSISYIYIYKYIILVCKTFSHASFHFLDRFGPERSEALSSCCLILTGIKAFVYNRRGFQPENVAVIVFSVVATGRPGAEIPALGLCRPLGSGFRPLVWPSL